jgi:predicted Rossmann fold flavoprotein
VLDIIRFNLEKNGVREQTGATVVKIKRNGDCYKITTKESGEFFAKSVIVAVGGSAGKQFGTDGTSYSILEDLGHKKSKIYPSLVQLKTDVNIVKGLKGLKEVVNIKAIKDGREIKRSKGDLLFTEYGVSGSSVFAISSATAGLNNVTLSVEFLPDISEKEVVDILKKRNKLGYIPDSDALLGLVNKRIGQVIIKNSKEKTPEGIAKTLKNFLIPIKGDLGFNYAQVTKGGIITDTINSKTMESKLNKGLYVVGEVLDVDGDCGGYNLTFAFVSGITAARDIKRRKENL